MRKVVLMSLVMVLTFGTMAFAVTKNVDVNINISEYAELYAPGSIDLTMDRPGQSKTVWRSLIAKANYPITISLTSNGKDTAWGTGYRHPKLKGPNDVELVDGPDNTSALGWSTWIAIDTVGSTSGSRPNGLGEQYDVTSGLHNFYLMLNADWGGDEWYNLTAGTYSGEVTLTVGAQVGQ